MLLLNFDNFDITRNREYDVEKIMRKIYSINVEKSLKNKYNIWTWTAGICYVIQVFGFLVHTYITKAEATILVFSPKLTSLSSYYLINLCLNLLLFF